MTAVSGESSASLTEDIAMRHFAGLFSALAGIALSHNVLAQPGPGRLPERNQK